MLVATYPTKKAMREAIGTPLRYVETSMFGAEFKTDATLTVVGPSATNRKWYANVTVASGIIQRVK